MTRVLLAAMLGRVADIMAVLAIVLLVEDATGSYAVAGSVAAASAINRAGFVTLLGRLADRVGQASTLLACATINAAALVALLACARAGAAAAVLVVLGALQGASMPPFDACVGRLWRALTDGEDQAGVSFALDALVREVAVIVAPLLVAFLVAVWSPAVAIASLIPLRTTAAVVLARSGGARAQRGGAAAVGRSGALRVAGLRTVALAILLVGLVLGAVQVAIPAFATEHGSQASAGILFSFWALGSLLSGVWYGARRWSGPVGRRFALLLALIPLTILPLAFAGSVPAMAALMLVAGMPMAPMLTAAYGLIDALAPRGAATEAFALFGAAAGLGTAAGNAAAGQLVATAGAEATLLAAAAIAALAAPTAVGRRATLRTT